MPSALVPAAIGIGGSLLANKVGGGGGGGGSSGSVSLQTPEQKEFLNAILGSLKGLTGQGLTPARFQSASASPLQQQAFGTFGGLGGLGQTGINLAGQQLAQFDPNLGGQFLGQAQGALQQGLQGFDPQRILSALEPGRQLALRTFQQDIVPNLLEQFGATSGQSGGLNRSLSEAGAGLSLGLGAQAAPFLGQAALAAPGQQLAGAQLGGQLAGIPGQLAQQGFGFGASGADLLGQLLNVGGIQRGIAGEQLAAQTQTQLDPRNILGQFGSLALGTQAFQPTFQAQSPGLFQSLLPALGSFAGSKSGSEAIAGLFS